MSNRCLVTGGCGFIGNHVVDFLVKMGNEVVVLDDLSGGFKENLNSKAIFIEGSINDKELVNYIFHHYNINLVYHLAAYAAEGLSHFIRYFNYKNNLLGSINLINASVNYGVKLFVFTSSIAVYGHQEPPFEEKNIPTPCDPYGIAKYSVEMDLKAAKDMFGLNYIIFRPFNVFGDKQNIGDKYRNVLGIWINQIMQNKPMTIFGDGEQTRAFTSVHDVAPIIAESYLHKNSHNETFNIGANKPYTINQLSKMVSKHMGVEHNVTYLPERKEVKHAYSSTEKLEKHFNYKAKISLDKAIKDMAIWAKNHGARKSKDFSNIEINKNLPHSWRKK